MQHTLPPYFYLYLSRLNPDATLTEMKNKLVTVLIFIALIFSSGNIFAQKISGIITDGKSGEPLVGAIVVLKGTQEGSATDVDGKFEVATDRQPPFVLVFT